MQIDQTKVAGETAQQRFERLLSHARFEGLKAILDRLAADGAALFRAVLEASTYEDLLGRLGYRLTLTRQIHVQDSYSRMGLPGGIKDVLPYHDIPTQSSLPTLVNSDATVTTTAKSVEFFGASLLELKRQIAARS